MLSTKMQIWYNGIIGKGREVKSQTRPTLLYHDRGRKSSRRIGTIVEWEGERWYVDNADDYFKDDGDETSLFLLPEKYADIEEYDKLWKSGDFDYVGYWIPESLVKSIEN